MKKILIFVIFSILLVGCGKEEKDNKKVDNSEYLFMDKYWTRTTEADTEHIKFRSDGGFSYYCDCGNPVNDSDICETYTYNDETKEIKLNCDFIGSETIDTIKIISVDKNILKLDFDGEIREFEREIE